MRLIKAANKLPDEDHKPGPRGWYSKLDSEFQNDVDEFIDAYNRGELTAKFPTLRKASTWLTMQIVEKQKVKIDVKTVEDRFRQRRQ